MNVKETVAAQRIFFATHETKDINFRLNMLKILRNSILKYEKKIGDALAADLRKSEFEAYATEIGIILDEIDTHIKHLKKWSAPQKVRTPLMHFPSKSFVLSEPFGVTLILAPWNYPFQLIMAPLIGAISTGNCVIVKPSEISSHTAQVIYDILTSTFPPDYIAAFLGAKEMNLEILAEHYDYIFFTGGPVFGKIVMRSAAENLTPITLELGGKSPCIVEDDAQLSIAAKRIAWGKFINAGQTCIAPDYLLVNRKIKDAFLAFMKHYLFAFYGDCTVCSPDFSRIIETGHFDRLISFIKPDQIFAGGTYDRDGLFIAPTILTGVSPSDPVMQEEIFGPILPVIEYTTLEEAIAFVNARPKPLAQYFFSESTAKQKEVLTKTSFGGGCINDTIIHLTNPYMPFGGVGSSGMGGYHGKKSFDTFTHAKSILKSRTWFDLPIRYAPYTKQKVKAVKSIMG